VKARAWQHGMQDAVCDVVEPWAHGTVVRATRYPTYFDYNAVRVEEDPAMSAEELAAVADEALAGLSHRRVDVEVADVGEGLRPDFERLGWLTQRLVWMRHEHAPPLASEVQVEEASFDDVIDLREAWMREDFPNLEAGDYFAEAREVALIHNARLLVVRDSGVPVAYAQLARVGGSAEIAQVYVRADHRGRGLGTAVTRAAIEAAGDVSDLWIVADDEARAKEIYARLGFRPVWRAVELLRPP
jgi:predicted GNAT family acetyltransferase